MAVKTETEFVVLCGENLPNHSESLAGRGKYVRVSGYNPNNNYPMMRTRESAYRLAAHILANCQDLPHEEDAATWDEVLDAVLESTSMMLDMDVEEVTE